MNEKDYKILIVDDEEDLCEILQFNLEGEGFVTETANSAEEALEKDIESFHLILLDVMMGEISGFKFANILKKQEIKIPIIFLTAKNTENDMLTGFTLGADDFIKKPFSIKEVVARIRAVLTRIKKSDTNLDSIIKYQNLVLDYQQKSILIDGKDAGLTKKEFEILALLLKNKDIVFSREQIMDKVWDEGTVITDRTIDVHITRLRKKIGTFGHNLVGKSGYGYSFKTIKK